MSDTKGDSTADKRGQILWVDYDYDYSRPAFGRCSICAYANQLDKVYTHWLCSNSLSLTSQSSRCLDITLCGVVMTMATFLGVIVFLTDFNDRAAEARVGPACSLETRGGRSQSLSSASEVQHLFLREKCESST